MSEKYIGVDLDGTLAHYDKWRGFEHIGEPIPKMLALVKDLISQGQIIKIFTARAVDEESIPYIKKWLTKHGLGDLEITATKSPKMYKFYDDRAAQVEKNKGKLLGQPELIKENIMFESGYIEDVFEFMSEGDTYIDCEGNSFLISENNELCVLDEASDEFHVIALSLEEGEKWDKIKKGTVKRAKAVGAKVDKYTLGKADRDEGKKMIDGAGKTPKSEANKNKQRLGKNIRAKGRAKGAAQVLATGGAVAAGVTALVKRRKAKKAAKEAMHETVYTFINENYGAVSEPGQEAGVKKMPEDSMPIKDMGKADSTNKDTETAGVMSQAAGQEKHPEGSMVNGMAKDDRSIKKGADSVDGGQEAGVRNPSKIAGVSVDGMFKK